MNTNEDVERVVKIYRERFGFNVGPGAAQVNREHDDWLRTALLEAEKRGIRIGAEATIDALGRHMSATEMEALLTKALTKARNNEN